MAIGDFWIKTPIINPLLKFLHKYMHTCDIHQYLIRQNVFALFRQKLTLTNNLSYTLYGSLCLPLSPNDITTLSSPQFC